MKINEILQILALMLHVAVAMGAIGVAHSTTPSGDSSVLILIVALFFCITLVVHGRWITNDHTSPREEIHQDGAEIDPEIKEIYETFKD